VPTSTRRGRVILWVVGLIPTPVLASPERVLLYLCCVFVGMAALWPPPGSLVDQWPDWAQYEWSVTMVLGGVASLVCQWTDSRFLERFGAAAVALAAVIYAWSLAAHSGLARTFTVAIFVSMGVAALIRYLRSTAYVSYVMNKRAGRGR
jgi:hypothetical protein